MRDRRRVSRFPAFETYAGWARIIGVSTYKCRKLMEATDVPHRFYGKLKVVYLSDWRRMNPDLFESLRLRRLLTTEEREEIDDSDTGT